MLNHNSSSKKNMHVIWDEDNLKQNEEIQKEYSVVRIQEPKTPYRPPLPSDSLEEDMRPLQLDEVAEALEPERMTAFEYVMSNGGASYDGAGSSERPPTASTSRLTSRASGFDSVDGTVGDKRREPSTSFTSSGSEGSGDKRRRFQQMRKQHYNMKDALLKAKKLLASEDEEDGEQPELDRAPEEQDEDEEDDTAWCSRGNGSAHCGGNSASQQEPIQHQSNASNGLSQQQQQQQAEACAAGSTGQPRADSNSS